MYILDSDILSLIQAGHPRVGQWRRRVDPADIATTIITRIEILRARFDHLLKADTGEELQRAQQWLIRGTQAMLESPLIQDLVAERVQELVTERVQKVVTERLSERAHQYILTILETRFGEVPRDLAEEIQSVVDDPRLTDLVRTAASCSGIEAFRDAIEQALRCPLPESGSYDLGTPRRPPSS